MTETKRSAGDIAFLEEYLVGTRTLTSINAVRDMLPGDPDALDALSEHCTQAALTAMEAGYHVDADRLANLSRQLKKRSALLRKDAEDDTKDESNG